MPPLQPFKAGSQGQPNGYFDHSVQRHRLPQLQNQRNHLGYEKVHTHPKSKHLLMSRRPRGKSHINGNNRPVNMRCIFRIPHVCTPYPANGTYGHGVYEMRHKEWKMGTIVERIQPVSPSNLLNNMVQVFANTGNTPLPSNLRTPFGARHESTALCKWDVLNPKKKIETITHGRGAQLAKILQVKLTDKQCVEVCEWIEDNTPSTGHTYSAVLVFDNGIAAFGCTMCIFLFAMQCIYVVCVCVSQAVQRRCYTLPSALPPDTRTGSHTAAGFKLLQTRS